MTVCVNEDDARLIVAVILSDPIVADVLFKVNEDARGIVVNVIEDDPDPDLVV